MNSHSDILGACLVGDLVACVRDATGESRPHLEKVLRRLRESGWLPRHRGKHGGGTATVRHAAGFLVAYVAASAVDRAAEALAFYGALRLSSATFGHRQEDGSMRWVGRTAAEIASPDEIGSFLDAVEMAVHTARMPVLPADWTIPLRVGVVKSPSAPSAYLETMPRDPSARADGLETAIAFYHPAAGSPALPQHVRCPKHDVSVLPGLILYEVAKLFGPLSLGDYARMYRRADGEIELRDEFDDAPDGGAAARPAALAAPSVMVS
jgi:hypothetical protein